MTGYRPTVWCPNCHAPHAASLTACPECQWQETTRAAGELLEKHGFKPTPAPAPAEEDAVLWDAFEGRR